MCFAHFPKTTAPQKVIVTASFLLSISSNGLTLKEHVALDWTSWSIKSYDSHKWPTVLVDEVKGKPRIFEACFCGSLYSTFTTPFYPYAKKKKRLQTLIKDQLDRSKATCSFNFVVLQKVPRTFHIQYQGIPGKLINKRDFLGIPGRLNSQSGSPGIPGRIIDSQSGSPGIAGRLIQNRYPLVIPCREIHNRDPLGIPGGIIFKRDPLELPLLLIMEYTNCMLAVNLVYAFDVVETFNLI